MMGKLNAWALALTLAALPPAFSASAARADDGAKSLGQHRSWSAYQYQENGEPVCFIAAKPTRARLDRRGRNRGDIYFLVTNWMGQGKKGEPSVVIGYPLRENSTVEVSVGGKTFNLQTAGEGAWLDDEADEKRLIEAMKAGTDMIVKGTSSSGTKSTDTYSLMGVTSALQAIDQACS